MRENVLKEDLQEIRKAIDEFTVENQRPPQSLQDLLSANFLHSLAVDPVTNKADWVVKFGDVELVNKQHLNGIVDLHSSEGSRYETW